MSTQKTHIKTIAIVVTLTVMFAFLVMYFGMLRPALKSKEIKINGTYLTTPVAIQPFSLTDNQNHLFNQDNLKGHWSMVFFGFTNCGMICPTTMAALNQMYKKLQQQLPDNQLPQVVFISVDPDRDSVARLNDYVNAFNPHFIGARTNINDTVKLEEQFHIVAQKVQVDNLGKDHYTINHSAEILLVNPEGKLQAYFSFPHEADVLAKEYKSILGA